MPICDLREGENALFPLASGEKLALLSTVRVSQQEWENYLQVYDPATSRCTRFAINDPFYIHNRSRARLHKDRLYLYNPEDPAGPSLTVINANTGEHMKKFSYEMDFRAIMSKELLFIQFNNGNYKSYKLSDFSLETERNIGDARIGNATGIYHSTFKGKKMAFDFLYPQPAPISTAPAIHDWNNNTVTQGGDFYLRDAINSIAIENSQSLGIIVARVNLENNIVVAGYKDYEEQNKGGVMYINFDGEVLLNIPLDYVPFEIVIRN